MKEISIKQQTMTSLEIAELTGKQHKDVLKAIRNMETAWEKVQGRKFSLLQKTYDLPNGGKKMMPYYQLTKTECLYIATKFNDEARAKLVLRWEELEHDVRNRMEEERRMSVCQPKAQEIRLLACDEEVLNEADDIMGDELAELNRRSMHCYTPTEIGRPFGLDARDLNSFLADQKIIRWAKGQWRLTKKYQHQDLTEDRYRYVHGYDGRRKLMSSLVWTEKGREFVLGLIH